MGGLFIIFVPAVLSDFRVADSLKINIETFGRRGRCKSLQKWPNCRVITISRRNGVVNMKRQWFHCCCFFNAYILVLLLLNAAVRKLLSLVQGLAKIFSKVTASFGNNKIKNEQGSKDDKSKVPYLMLLFMMM